MCFGEDIPGSNETVGLGLVLVHILGRIFLKALGASSAAKVVTGALIVNMGRCVSDVNSHLTDNVYGLGHVISPPSVGRGVAGNFAVFNNRELETTDTELIAMAAPARTGEMMPKAAKGIIITL